MNVPFIGQNFSNSNGIFEANIKGAYTLVQFWISERRGIMADGNDKMFSVCLFPDGSFTNASLVPRLSYFLLVDRYVYHPKGRIKIIGRYPDYETSEGIKVWMDHDGSFITAPVDLKPRLIARRKCVAALGKAFRDVTAPSKAVAGLRQAITDEGTQWRWTVFLYGEARATGLSDNRKTAEQLARDARKAFASDLVLSKRTKGVTPILNKGRLTCVEVPGGWRVVWQVFKLHRNDHTPVDDKIFPTFDAADKHRIQWRRIQNWKTKKHEIVCPPGGGYEITGTDEWFPDIKSATDRLRELRDETISTKT